MTAMSDNDTVHTNPDGTQVSVTLGYDVTLGNYMTLGDGVMRS